MEQNIKVILLKERNRDKVNIIWIIFVNMKESLKMIRFKDMVNVSGLVTKFMKDNGHLDKWKAKGN